METQRGASPFRFAPVHNVTITGFYSSVKQTKQKETLQLIINPAKFENGIGRLGNNASPVEQSSDLDTTELEQSSDQQSQGLAGKDKKYSGELPTKSSKTD